MPIGTIMQEGSLRGRIQLQETLHGIVAIPSSVGSANWNEIADKPFSTLDENTLRQQPLLDPESKFSQQSDQFLIFRMSPKVPEN